MAEKLIILDETDLPTINRSQLKTWKFIGMCNNYDKWMLIRRDDLSEDAEDRLYEKKVLPESINDIEQCYAAVSRQTPEFMYFKDCTIEDIKEYIFSIFLNDYYDNMFLFDTYEELLLWWAKPITDEYGKQIIRIEKKETLDDYAGTIR